MTGCSPRRRGPGHRLGHGARIPRGEAQGPGEFVGAALQFDRDRAAGARRRAGPRLRGGQGAQRLARGALIVVVAVRRDHDRGTTGMRRRGECGRTADRDDADGDAGGSYPAFSHVLPLPYRPVTVMIHVTYDENVYSRADRPVKSSRQIRRTLVSGAEITRENAAGLAEVRATIDAGPYDDTWESLAAYRVPRWFREAKFGIFVHWGVYSVPAFGSEWYPRNMYRQGTPEFEHHVATYGPAVGVRVQGLHSPLHDGPVRRARHGGPVPAGRRAVRRAGRRAPRRLRDVRRAPHPLEGAARRPAPGRLR